MAMRMKLVTHLRERGVVVSELVDHALREVPRHLFVPDADQEHAYLDDAVVVKRDDDGRALASASEPTIVATMLEQLQVSRGHRVLEVGTGTGYNAALLAVLVGPEGDVVSVEVDPDLAEHAAMILSEIGADRVQVVTGNGQAGYPVRSPYDRVMVTAGAREVASSWSAQLTDGGRMVVPIVDEKGIGSIVAFDKVNGELVRLQQTPCGFVPMRSDPAA